MASRVVIGGRVRRQKCAEWAAASTLLQCVPVLDLASTESLRRAVRSYATHSARPLNSRHQRIRSFYLRWERGYQFQLPLARTGHWFFEVRPTRTITSPIPVKIANCYPQAVYKVILDQESASSYKLLTWKHWYMLKVVPHISPGQRLCFWLHNNQYISG